MLPMQPAHHGVEGSLNGLCCSGGNPGVHSHSFWPVPHVAPDHGEIGQPRSKLRYPWKKDRYTPNVLQTRYFQKRYRSFILLYKPLVYVALTAVVML